MAARQAAVAGSLIARDRGIKALDIASSDGVCPS
jgi:hypothetical protein